MMYLTTIELVLMLPFTMLGILFVCNLLFQKITGTSLVDFICELLKDWTKQAEEYKKAMGKIEDKEFLKEE